MPSFATEDNKLLGNLSDEHKLISHSPLRDLIFKLPSLLIKLLDKGALISLERLQLLYCDIEISASEGAFDEFINIEIKREGRDGHKLLELRGQWRSFLVVLTYGERGARKYVKQSLCSPPLELMTIKAIRACDVRHFLQSINQDNRFFYDDKIRELNGFPARQVPIEMLLLELSALAHRLMKKPARAFSFIFSKAIPQDQELKLSLWQENDRTTIHLQGSEQEVVQLICLA
jgi:hypothetical protein